MNKDNVLFVAASGVVVALAGKTEQFINSISNVLTDLSMGLPVSVTDVNTTYHGFIYASMLMIGGYIMLRGKNA